LKGLQDYILTYSVVLKGDNRMLISPVGELILSCIILI